MAIVIALAGLCRVIVSSLAAKARANIATVVEIMVGVEPVGIEAIIARIEVIVAGIVVKVEAVMAV